MLHQQPDAASARAFNRGCDARLAGKPEWHNPYGQDNEPAVQWKRGWYDVDRNWGVNSQTAPALRPVVRF